MWSNKCNNNNVKITPFIPVLAGWNLHMSQTPSYERWDAWPTKGSAFQFHYRWKPLNPLRFGLYRRERPHVHITDERSTMSALYTGKHSILNRNTNVLRSNILIQLKIILNIKTALDETLQVLPYCQNGPNYISNLFIVIKALGSTCGVMAIIVGNGHGDTSSNPRREWLRFT